MIGFQIGAVMSKEFRHMVRDPRMSVLLFVAPILQLFMFGYAATFDLYDLRVVVVDHDHSGRSHAFIRQVDASRAFLVTGSLPDSEALELALVNGDAQLGLVFPQDYGERLEAGEPVAVQVLVDGTDSNSSTVAISYLGAIALEAGVSLMVPTIRATPSGADIVDRGATRGESGLVVTRDRVWYNPELRSIHFMVPGVIVMILVIMTMVLSALGLVREKELGMMEQLLVRPIRPAVLILGKLLPFVAVGLFDVILVVAVAIFWFGVPLKGSLLLLLALSVLFLMSTVGLGLFVSTVSSSQQQAMITSFMIVLPMVLLSGFIFPIPAMPEVVQWMTTIIPVRYFLVIIRAIFLKGVGLPVLWPDVLKLGAIGVGVLSGSIIRFKTRLA